MKNKKNNSKRAKSIVDELLAPTNQREYQNVLNKKIQDIVTLSAKYFALFTFLGF